LESIEVARKVVNALLKTETRTAPAPRGGAPSTGFNAYMMDPRIYETLTQLPPQTLLLTFSLPITEVQVITQSLKPTT
jgi:hypothetical protein